MNTKARGITEMLLLCLAVCLIAAGIMRGELAPIFTKAVHICLECIGLG